jgi:hypothetical protein
VRGGLDEALERLARRDKLRRLTNPDDSGTPPEVHELAEAVAAVVTRYPQLAITMGVVGAGPPVLLRVAVQDGVVHVSADNPTSLVASDDARSGVVIDLEPEEEAPAEAAEWVAEAEWVDAEETRPLTVGMPPDLGPSRRPRAAPRSLGARRSSRPGSGRPRPLRRRRRAARGRGWSRRSRRPAASRRRPPGTTRSTQGRARRRSGGRPGRVSVPGSRSGCSGRPWWETRHGRCR